MTITETLFPLSSVFINKSAIYNDEWLRKAKNYPRGIHERTYHFYNLVILEMRII